MLTSIGGGYTRISLPSVDYRIRQYKGKNSLFWDITPYTSFKINLDVSKKYFFSIFRVENKLSEETSMKQEASTSYS
jgi:hypothetical protein